MTYNSTVRARRPACLAKNNVGSDRWWAELARKGTPLQTPVDDQRVRVDFFWRDPQGLASDIAKVQLVFHSVSSEPPREVSLLKRVAGTDVFHAYVIMQASWRASYRFIPLTTADLDQKQARTRVAGYEQHYDWLQHQSFTDPCNHRPDISNASLPSGSPLHGLEAGYELGWEEWDRGELLSVSVHTLTWASPWLGNERNVTCFETGTTDLSDKPVVTLLDGECWSKASGLPDVLNFLTQCKLLSPAVYIMVGSVGAEQRVQEFTANDDFWLAFFEELIPKLKLEFGLPPLAQNMLVAGQELGGLSALQAGLYWPQYITKVISLSGAFWWPDKRREPLAKADANSVRLMDQVMASCSPLAQLSVYFAAGEGERTLLAHNEEMAYVLQHKQSKVLYENYAGGHDWLSWRSSLIRGLSALLDN
ncbi:enterochelin esterase [Marinomonas ostreistagni]|uniref:enterochelin esterase n=1 Tax=Marinomonas ostreistagni TaxID=359209 RepID=UPI0019509BC9|nr:enterochelin esterase [Marinomonas ostreistagni]